MKKLLFLILLLIPLVSGLELEQNSPVSYQGRELTLVGIVDNKILVSVDGEKNIVNLNQQKEINGIKITLNEIFYAGGEFSTADVDIELAYTCGDGTCNEFETYSNCCQDCGCDSLTTDKCVENKCITPSCNQDSDCTDNSELTEDYCSDYECKFRRIRCSTNVDCNDNNPDTDDLCNSGNCANILNYVCKINSDCEDSNPCTVEKCINKDCFYEQEPNCIIGEETTDDNEDINENNEITNINPEKGFLYKIREWILNLFK
jgi:hypothetical protein